MNTGARTRGKRWMPRSAREAKRMTQLGVLAARLRDEKLQAEPVVRTIRRMAAAQIAVALPAEWITAAVAEGLTDASEEAAAASPAVALALANYALEVATRLDAGYPSIVRPGALARAWTAIALAHGRSGELQPALAALDRADAALHGHAALAHDRALVDAARANVLHAFGRDGEALPLLRAAASAFDAFGDSRRSAGCLRLMQVIRGR